MICCQLSMLFCFGHVLKRSVGPLLSPTLVVKWAD